MKLYVIYHSGAGHTKVQAEAVQRGAATVEGVESVMMTAEEAIDRIDELDSAGAIIFGSPTYMGSMSAKMKEFCEVAASKWFTQAWKDKVAGAFTNSSSFSGDKLNTLFGLMVNAMQHGMIYVGNAMLPSANDPDQMNSIDGPGPDAHNRVGSNVGPMAASFQVKPPNAPPKGDVETAEIYGHRVASIALKLDQQ